MSFEQMGPYILGRHVVPFSPSFTHKAHKDGRIVDLRSLRRQVMFETFGESQLILL